MLDYYRVLNTNNNLMNSAKAEIDRRGGLISQTFIWKKINFVFQTYIINWCTIAFYKIKHTF